MGVLGPPYLGAGASLSWALLEADNVVPLLYSLNEVA